MFFRQSWMAYLAYVLVPVMWIWLYRTGSGLRSRAAGENAAAVDAAGIDVIRIRYLSTFFGAVLAGFGGAYLSLFYTPGWKETMTGGQGWAAIAMVMFASWNPVRALQRAFLFGGPTALQFYFQQAAGIDVIPSFVLKMLPYVLTVSVMVVVNPRAGRQRGLLGPAALGHPFSRED
ncbi:MAG: ABC transporter permease [Desulfobacterales bacterium]